MGRDVDPETLASGLTEALDAYEAARREGTAAADATWFDLLTLAAFVIFREAGVAWAVVEVGLGGRLDSTNIVDGEVAVVTNIGLEHTEILGATRAAIAGEKAGILKPGAILVTTLAADDEAGRVAHARARALGCEVVVSDAGEGATIEETNVALAGAVLDALGRKGVTARAGAPVGAALLDAETRARARLVGRMERFTLAGRVRPLHVVLDGAHVPFNIAAVLSDLERWPELAGPCVAVVALARDKDAHGFLAELGRRASADRAAPACRRRRAAFRRTSLHAIAAVARDRQRGRARPGTRSGAARSLPRRPAPGCSLRGRSIWSGRCVARPAAAAEGARPGRPQPATGFCS